LRVFTDIYSEWESTGDYIKIIIRIIKSEAGDLKLVLDSLWDMLIAKGGLRKITKGWRLKI